jgi:AbrB family looped-hinge helix DNA binding protein
MVRITVPVRQEGRIVIPSAVRQRLELHPDDLVELDLQPVTESER